MTLPHQAPCRRKCTQQAHSSYTYSREEEKKKMPLKYVHMAFDEYLHVCYMDTT